MQLWFQALFGIFSARILRLDDFFPSGHLDSAARISRSPAPNDLSCLSEIDQRRVDVSTGISNVSCKEMCVSVGRSVCRRVFYLGVQIFCSETLSSSAFSTYPACIHVLLYCTYSCTVVHVYIYRRGRCLLLVSSTRRKHPTQLFVDRGAALPAPLQYGTQTT